MPTRRAAAVLAGLLVVAAAGCTAGPEPPPAPVTLGLLVDSTGPLADAVPAAELAVRLVNESYPGLRLPLAATTGLPGRGGPPLVLAVRATDGDPTRAEEAVASLRDEGAVAVVAAEIPTVVAAAAAAADRRRIPLVDAATSASFLEEMGLDWYFRTGPGDRTLAEAALEVVAVGSTTRRLTVLDPAGGAGADVTAMVADLARSAGFTVTVRAVPGSATGEPSGIDDPTAGDPVGTPTVTVVPTAADRRPLTQVAASAGPVVAFGPGLDGPADEAGRVAGPPGLLRAPAWSAAFAERQPSARAVGALYQEWYGRPMTGTAAAVLTAVLAVAQAVDEAADLRPESVRAALRQLDVPATRTIMPWRGIRFADNGQNELASAVVEQWTGDGIRLVHPPELASVVPGTEEP